MPLVSSLWALTIFLLSQSETLSKSRNIISCTDTGDRLPVEVSPENARVDSGELMANEFFACSLQNLHSPFSSVTVQERIDDRAFTAQEIIQP